MSADAQVERAGGWISIEETATRLGVSVATARRMAADGRIPAAKSGRQWLVDGARLDAFQLPGQRRRSRPDLDYPTALRHVRRTDLTELWVPDLLREADSLAAADALIARSRDVVETLAPGNAVDVEVDKSALLARRGTLLSLEDRVAYQAAVASFASRADAQTPDCVFSARLSPHRDYFLKNGAEQWVAWRKHVLDQLESGEMWMAKTDLTAYFDTVRHDYLIAEIESLNANRDVVRAISAMLGHWADVPRMGLPTGPNASRLLGNLYMLPVDRAMLAEGWAYSRFLDDIRIVAPSKEEAIAAIRAFQRECTTRGLLVSSAKTELVAGADARKELLEDADLAHAEYLMHAPPLARKELAKLLRNALRADAQVNLRHAKFSLRRLALLRDRATLGLVLRKLEDLAPLGPIVAMYLRPLIDRPQVVRGLTSFLADSGRSRSPQLVTWVLAVMLEYPGLLPAEWSDQASQLVKDRNQRPYLRAIAAVVLARSGRAADVTWVKHDIPREHDPAVLRGYAVALYWANALDKRTQGILKRRSPDLDTTLRYLAGRATLPSLVYTDGVLKVPTD